MGFKDGTNNPSVADTKAMAALIWVGTEGPNWMRGGSYLVARRIRIALEHWDRMQGRVPGADGRPAKGFGRAARRQRARSTG